ncbi:hypothetical protein SUGI_1162990 [Cryptomeria japonica]|uniref:serine/threonine-protein kinase-like protein ACR4 n=1 Tax=Cryptomeria japonica TaxID=3369 RepID=UPI0024149F3E|nr:serine/threonine-protein kinase-like protein ACR4 [Cryptomeria japonica]GLJ54228.1 hypothetical protein SUGI_1162990 [Cryptomeria japonica]
MGRLRLTQLVKVTANLNKSMHHKQGRNSVLIFDLILASVCIVLACFTICVFCILKQLRMRVEKDEEEENSMHKCAPTLAFTEVEKATDGFTNRRLLGRGRYGSVYKAIFPDGQVMAIKRIDPSQVLRFAGKPTEIFSFSAEIRALSRAHHPNIVPLIGYCEAPGERILAMPFQPGKSLQYHLHEGGVLFGWSQRVKILYETALGIEYLHEGTAPFIIHGNLKPSNVLLDSTWSARIVDFGLAFLAPPNQMSGTLGYLDPEYYTDLNLAKASDMYSFGVLMLEMLSGRPCFGGDERKYIVDWAVPLIMASRTGEVLDPKLGVPRNVEPLIRMTQLACRCVKRLRKDRPTILEVVVVLNKIEMDMAAEMDSPNRFSSAYKMSPSRLLVYFA